jgi:hypothetical protein
MATESLGEFVTAGEAQRAAEASNGGRRLRWARQDMAGGIEHYVGNCAEWWPLDIPSRLEAWWDSDQGVKPTTADEVTEWNSFDGSGTIEATQTVPANAPTLVAEAGPNGFDVVRFNPAAAETMLTNLPSFLTPFTVSVVASHQPTANASAVVMSIGVMAVIRENLGTWELVTNVGTLATGLAVVTGQLTVLTVSFDGTDAELWIDGVSAGSVGYTLVPAAVSFSDGAAWWGGDLMSAVFADTVLPATVRTSLINYQMRRYNLS